ncbi:Eisosome component PIL1-domain-containing protein [Chlamydoabsidia padenii]|nr:Eisosome component PIL1-domain-containing protein [Chlamydoabsidia padenii]
MVARYQQYRHAIKSIREREDALCDTREKRRSLSSRLNHLQKTNPHSPKRHDIESDLAALDHDTQRAEIELGDFKRFALKEAFYIRFNAMVEYADKLKMIAGFGKYIVDLLDVEPTQEPARKPYTSETQASLILNDCLLALDQWVPDQEDERPTFLANQDIVDDEDANVLTEEDIRYYREQGLASLKAPPSLGNKTNDGDQQPPLYVDDGHQWNDEKKPPGIQQQPLLTAKQEQVEQTRKNDNHPPAYSPSISNISPATSITEPTAGLVCSDTHHLPTSSFSSAHVYHPQLEGCQLDYYQVYRNKLLHTPHQPRSYASFQQQFVSNRSKENIPSE